MDRRDIRDLSLRELEEWVAASELKPYAVTQVVQWLYNERVDSFEEMTNLSKRARALLATSFTIGSLEIAALHPAKDGTVKLAFRLADGAIIESVLMPQSGRITLCVSSQVGCAMGCTFCKTATMKLVRNLTLFEILGQVIAAIRFLESDHELATTLMAECRRVTNIVYMGMGEPLHNLGPVIESVRILLHERAFKFSKRRVTVSTCGLAPQIIELNREVPARLSVSLNAANDRLRTEIMPINQRYDIAELMAACRTFAKGRRYPVTFEYVLLQGINDSRQDAAELVRQIAHTPCKLNLIPFNEYAGSPYRRPTEQKILAFHQYLADRGFQVNIRYSKGLDVMAACGQLATDLNQEEICIDSLAS